jgi:hypothetical protein
VHKLPTSVPILEIDVPETKESLKLAEVKKQNRKVKTNKVFKFSTGFSTKLWINRLKLYL